MCPRRLRSTCEMSGFSQSWTAASPAAVPSSRRVLQDADDLGAERDAVQRGDVAVLAADPDLAIEALVRERATAPPAIPSFSERTAWMSLSVAVRIVSMLALALSGSQSSV